jgi:hypothetical protein
MSGVSCTITKPPRPPHDKRKSHHDLSGQNFLCLDGEGVTAHGRHDYVLFGMGDDQIEDTTIGGLGFTDIMPFIYDRYKKGQTNPGFFLGYDFTQWFKSLPEERAWRLLTKEGQASRRHKRPGLPPHPVEYGGWQFDLLGNKRFRLRPKNCDCPFPSCKCPGKAPWQYICDTGGFFQCSLLKVINPKGWVEPIVTPEEYAYVLAGKSRRATAQLDDEMRFYNRLENNILARVLKEVDKGFRGIDVNLSASKWFGPGQAAQEWLKGKAPTKEEVSEYVPDWFLEAARASYFGGWFEIMMHGIVPGESHEYDINSAYPAIIATLPCLLHGSYSRGNGDPPSVSGRLTLVRARVASRAYGERRSPQYIGAMLHRDAKGRISRPMITEGWYWQHEIDAAKRAKCISKVDIYEWVAYAPCDCLPPLRRVANLYLQRLAVGKNSALGKGAKLVYNSDYGKFAQSVGNPMFGNPVYASLITAGCRSQILDAIATHPKGKSHVAMVATDAVYFLSPHPNLRISEALGEWDYKSRTNLALFKPGVYWDDDTRAEIARGADPVFKARGVNANDFGRQLGRIDAEFMGWASSPPAIRGLANGGENRWPSVSFRPSFSMTTALQALRRNDWSQAGHVTQGSECDPVTQDSNPSGKRCNTWYDETMQIARSEPYWTGEGASIDSPASTPYKKRFGLDNPWSEESLSRNGVTPDGYAGSEFRDILLGDV